MEATTEQTEARVYFLAEGAFFKNIRFGAKSLITSSKDPGPPWQLYDEAKHGKAYLRCHLDSWLKTIGQG